MKERVLELESELQAKSLELKKNKEILSLLTETSKAITSETELERLAQRIVDKATALSGARFGALLYNRTVQGKEVTFHFISGSAPKGLNSALTQTKNAKCFKSLKTVCCDDLSWKPKKEEYLIFNGIAADQFPIRSYLAVPIVNPITKTIIGGVYLAHEHVGIFTKKEQVIVEGITLQGAIALGNARLFEEKIHTETLLIGQTESYKSILDATFDAVIIIDSQANIAEVNEAARNIFCYSDHQFIGKHVKEILTSYDPRFLSFETLQQQNLHFQSQGAVSTGRSVALDCRARLFNYKNCPHILLNLRDTSEQLKTEAALRRSTSFAETISEASPVVLWLTNEYGELTFFNSLWYKWTGTQEKTQLGFGWIDCIHEKDREGFLKHYRDCFKSKAVLDVDVRLNSTGEKKWVNFHAEPYVNDEYFFSGMAGSIMDITSRKEAQADLQRRNLKTKEELEELVKERTSELEKINYELFQFSSIVSHDLKEPVRKISVFSQLLKDRSAEKIDAVCSKYIDNIIRSSGRMMTLISDLLSFSRLSHIEDSSFVNIDLNNLLDQVLQDLELPISEKNATINADDLPEIAGVPVQITQMFQNLISNSLKFSDASRKLIITIKYRQINDNTFEIIYRDNGIGFNDTQKNKIFDVFQRLHTKDNYEGTGIGLSIVKKIISLHKGHVEAFGYEGKGAEFRITLPYSLTSETLKVAG